MVTTKKAGSGVTSETSTGGDTVFSPAISVDLYGTLEIRVGKEHHSQWREALLTKDGQGKQRALFAWSSGKLNTSRDKHLYGTCRQMER